MLADKYFHEERSADQLRHRFNFIQGRYKTKAKYSHDMRLTVKNAASEIHNVGPIPSTSQVSVPQIVESRSKLVAISLLIFDFKLNCDKNCRRRGRKLGQAKPMSNVDRNLINFFQSSISLPGRRKKYVAAEYVQPIIECLRFLNVDTLSLSDINLDDENLWTDLERDIVSSLKE